MPICSPIHSIRVTLRPLKISDILLALQYALYFITLLCVYIYGIVPVYAYMGFLDEFSAGNMLFSILILVFVAPLLRPDGFPSSFFLNVAASLVLIPTLVIYTGAGLPHRYALITTVAISLIAIITKTFRPRPLKLPLIHSSKLLLLLALLSTVTILGVFLFGGARFLNFNLSAVYDIRREAADNLPRFFGYLNSLVTKVAIPFGLVFALHNRRWLAAAAFASMSILLFGLTAHKSPLFYPLTVAFVYLIAQSRYLTQYFLAALIAIVLISALDLWFFLHGAEGISGWFASLLARRAILVPSLLNYYFLDFFTDAPKYFWADSKVTLGLVASPHDLRAVNLIGLEYFGKQEMSANTGWIGSGYANAGLWGITLYSIFIGLLLAVLDTYARRLGTRMVVALFILPLFTLLTSTDLTTMLLTHGLLFSIFLLTLVKSNPQSRAMEL
jgi:hypothetical protein